jgi:hypothetical protein
MRFSLILMALAMSAAAIAQPNVRQDGYYQIGYAANLNIGDSIVNLTNSGWNGGFYGAMPASSGNICVNVYVFDPQEEEIGCCSCLVTPNGLNSLSVKSDLISNNLTPAVPISVVLKLTASIPNTDTSGAFTVCNPATVAQSFAGPLRLVNGLVAWGTTLEPAATSGTYATVNVPYINSGFIFGTGTEAAALTTVCGFIQSNGTGFGICKSCRLGALGGDKQ